MSLSGDIRQPGHIDTARRGQPGSYRPLQGIRLAENSGFYAQTSPYVRQRAQYPPLFIPIRVLPGKFMGFGGNIQTSFGLFIDLGCRVDAFIHRTGEFTGQIGKIPDVPGSGRRRGKDHRVIAPDDGTGPNFRASAEI